jgi:hypothetical protein
MTGICTAGTVGVVNVGCIVVCPKKPVSKSSHLQHLKLQNITTIGYQETAQLGNFRRPSTLFTGLRALAPIDDSLS